MGRRIITSLFQKIGILVLFFALANTAQARIIFTNDLLTNDANIFRIGGETDALNTDIAIEFGNPLSNQESISWNFIDNRFEFSNDLAIEGRSITLDSANIGVGNDVQIVANQGSDIDGGIRYNSIHNQWEISNNGAPYYPIALASPDAPESDLIYIYTVLGGQAINTSATPIIFDTQERIDPAFTHINGTAPVSINHSDKYIINYECTLESDSAWFWHSANHWLEINSGGGFTEIPGTRSASYHRNAANGRTVASIMRYIELNNGDQIRAVAQASSDGYISTSANGCRLMINTAPKTIQEVEILDAFDATGNIAINQTQETVNLDTTRIIDPAYTLINNEISFNKDGIYKFTGRLTAESVNNSGQRRASIELRFQEKKTGSFTNVPGAYCKDYIREQGTMGRTGASCSITWIGEYDAGDQIRMTHQKNQTTTMQTSPEGSGLTIERIRDKK